MNFYQEYSFNIIVVTTETMNDMLEYLFSINNLMETSIKKKLVKFYRYNDVNFSKGVSNWIFILKKFVHLFLYNKNEILIYQQNFDSTYFTNVFIRDYSFLNYFDSGQYLPVLDYAKDTISIEKTEFLANIDTYIRGEETTKFYIDEQKFYVDYANLEKLFKNILVLNQFIYTPKIINDVKNDEYRIISYNEFQYKTILQFLNFGNLQIYRENKDYAFVKNILSDKEKSRYNLNTVFDEIDLLNHEDSNQIYSNTNLLDPYKKKVDGI